jgi:hypothetical protein
MPAPGFIEAAQEPFLRQLHLAIPVIKNSTDNEHVLVEPDDVARGLARDRRLGCGGRRPAGRGSRPGRPGSKSARGRVVLL